MVGWVVTWDWSGDRVEVENEVVAVLRCRLSPKIVCEIVETLYASSQYTQEELVRFCAKNNGKSNPYRAHFHDIRGVPWQGRIYCGDGPRLRAQLVDDLRVFMDEDGNERLTWRDRPLPTPVAGIGRQ